MLETAMLKTMAASERGRERGACQLTRKGGEKKARNHDRRITNM
jgi:hypothetical protein